jgi:hypothetical protein
MTRQSRNISAPFPKSNKRPFQSKTKPANTNSPHKVQAFSSYGANEPFHIGILPRRSISCFDFLDTQALHALLKLFAKDGIVIMEQVLRCAVIRERFDNLLVAGKTIDPNTPCRFTGYLRVEQIDHLPNTGFFDTFCNEMQRLAITLTGV